MKHVFLLLILACGIAVSVQAQDPNERVYNYEALALQKNNGRITPKPKVVGWSNVRVKENLNRGLVAVRVKDGVYLSWRLLDTDAENAAFNVYRSSNGGVFKKINGKPVEATTDFMDARASKNGKYRYEVRCVTDGIESASSEQAVPLMQNYRSIKLQGDYVCQKLAVGDLNGDGNYDIVIKQPSQATDPGSWRKSNSTFKIEAYLSDGTFLWQKDLGWNIEQGVWYSPYVVADFNGDGKAEVAVKTAPTDVDYRDKEGRVVGKVPQYYGDGVTGSSPYGECPEYCSILNGMTGEEIDRVPWPEQSQEFGDYNRNNRNQMAVAYLDGKTPCLLINRGTYRKMQVDAYQLLDGDLELLWSWNGDQENPLIRSQGAHQIVCADVDGDKRDEVIMGSVVIDDNGEALWCAGIGHPDKAIVGDIDPENPGLEILYAAEVWHDKRGVILVDAATGRELWQIGHDTKHVGDAMAVDLDPAYPGLECFASEDGKGGKTGETKYFFTSKGERLGSTADVPGCREWIWWDGDLIRETTASAMQQMPAAVRTQSAAQPSAQPATPVRRTREFSIKKYKAESTITDLLQGSIIMIADLFGDWREEIVTMQAGEIRIYTTTIPASDKRVTLMQDNVYRSYIYDRSMGYDQAPMTGYYLATPVAESVKYTPLTPKR